MASEQVIKQKEEGSKDKDGNNILENINGGSYISIFNEDEGNYDLIWLPDNFLRENGEPDEEVIEKCKRRITEEEEKEISNILSDRNNYNRDGKFIAKDKLAAANQKLNDLVQSSSKIIKNFAERGGGKIICTSDADNKDKKSELINKIKSFRNYHPLCINHLSVDNQRVEEHTFAEFIATD